MESYTLQRSCVYAAGVVVEDDEVRVGDLDFCSSEMIWVIPHVCMFSGE